MIDVMKRTQIQLPDPLYRRVKEVAKLEDWSISEVIRKGAESIVRHYPPIKEKGDDWQFPPPVKGKRLRVTDPVALRELVADDMERIPGK